MKNIFLVNALLLLNTICFAQFSDNFDDGDLLGWVGNDTDFIVDAELHLQLFGDDSLGGTAYVSTPVSINDTATWEFYVEYDFDPSNSNYSKIYLMSDVAEITGSVNGYYLRIGKDGTADVAELYRQAGMSTTLMMSGTINLSVSPNVRVKVVRTTGAEWQLYIDSTGGFDYVFDGSVIDATYPGGDFIGVTCKYTSTRFDQFNFDDFNVGPLYVDVDGPVLLTSSIINSTTLELDFNEPLDITTAESVVNYIVDGGVGNPVNAELNAGDASKVTLTFGSPFPEAVLLTLTVSGVADLVGNVMSSTDKEFTYYTVTEHDILITEIFADIDPQVGLPMGEYIELYNNTTVPIDLKRFFITDATTQSEAFESYILNPDSYVILFDVEVADQFTAYPNILPVASLPSLNNDGDDLKLIDSNTITIHEVEFSIEWYDNAIKAEGGWSLEMIDPSNPCQGDENWTASNDENGGTPGALNSVNAPNPDDVSPSLLNAFPTADDTVIAFFDEALVLENILVTDFTISEGIGNPVSLILNEETPEMVGLILSTPLIPGIIYTLTANNVADCSGNSVSLFNSVILGLPEQAELGDIAINEILFNPHTDGFDFVEIYNTSEKIIDLSKIIIAEQDLTDTTETLEFGYISEDGRLFLPHTYLCASLNIEDVINTYMSVDTGNFIEMAELPGYPDNEGIVSIYDAALNVIDWLHYYDDWHYELLTEDEGVSLERVNFDFETQNQNNWHSAAADVRYATPGYQNSVFGNLTGGGAVELEYPVFSPDGDGYHDLLLISYSTPEEGYTGQFKIFDAQGRLIKDLTNLELLSREGFVTWDGIDNDSNAGRSGIYILYAELFNLDGNVEKYKMKFTLVRK